MRKTLVLILILSMTLALFCFIPTVYAEDTNLADSTYEFDNINTTTKDGNEYYINIKSPTKFVSVGKLLAVVQGNDIIVKMDTTIEVLKDATTVQKDGNTYVLNGMTASLTSVRGTREIGNLYLNYTYEGSKKFITKVYKYTITYNTNCHMYEPIDLGTYVSNNVSNPLSPDTITAFNESVSDIYAIDNVLYAIVFNEQSVHKITIADDGSVQDTKLNINEAYKSRVVEAKEFAANNVDNIYIYSAKDDIIYKGTNNGGEITFESFMKCTNLRDMAVNNTHLFVLGDSSLDVYTKDKLPSEAGGDAPKLLYSLPISGIGNTIMASKVSTHDYISYTNQNSHNITTYEVVTSEGKASLVFQNHYGANCTCETPHEGWLNAPRDITVSIDHRLIYVIDKDKNGADRLSVMTLGDNNYSQQFLETSTLGITNMNTIAIDRQNQILIASGNKLNVYSNSELYDTNTNPLTLKNSYAGFDGNIIDIYMSNKHESIAYVLTDNNSVYKIIEGKNTPMLVATFSEKIDAITVSFNNDRLYVASGSVVKSYAIGNINLQSPLTSYDTRVGIKELLVDYSGKLFIATDTNKINVYERISASDYSLIRVINSISTWENLETIYIDPATKDIYAVDSALHLASASKDVSNSTLYTNDKDVYTPNEVYDVDLLYVGKANKSTRLYLAPNNFEIYRDVELGEYFYVVAVDRTNNAMYEVIDNNNNIRYIEKTAIDEVKATEDTIIGTKFLPLFKETDVYKYPFSTAPVLSKVTGEMTFVNNVAFEGGKNVWQNPTTKWFKVEYVNEDGITLQGYVKMNEITKANSVNAPSTKIHLRVTTKAGEPVAMYDMPDVASGIIHKGIVDGTLVRLRGDKFDPNSLFTLVELEVDGKVKVGYIKTEYLQENKITTLQIVAIVVSIITVLITVLVIILAVQIKKKKSRENTFKSPSDFDE